jgi:hypothetical protein
MLILRIIVLIVSLPFAWLAALIPGYTAGRIVSVVGLPPAIGEYLVGGLVIILFCGYFQDRITPPKDA